MGLWSLGSLIVICGAVFLLKDPVYDRYQKYLNDKDIENRHAAVKLVSAATQNSTWKLFENEYFSLTYPNNWEIKEEKLNPTASYGGKYLLTLSTPTSLYPQKLAFPLYRISIQVYDSKIQSMGYTLNSSQKKEIENALEGNDIKKFANVFPITNFASYNHLEFTTLNGKQVRVSADGNEHFLDGPFLEFLSNGNHARVIVWDESAVLNRAIIGRTKDLLGVYKDRVYSKILESLKIK